MSARYDVEAALRMFRRDRPAHEIWTVDEAMAMPEFEDAVAIYEDEPEDCSLFWGAIVRVVNATFRPRTVH